MNQYAGIVLCGGRSRRMGRPKADLDFHGEPLLARTVRVLSEIAEPVIVAAAPDQLLPPLPRDVPIVRDPVSHLGPLAAFSAALEGVPAERAWVFLLGCDQPFLNIEVLRLLTEWRDGVDAVIPLIDNTWHPLTGLYRRSEVALVAGQLLSSGCRRMLDLIPAVRVARIDDAVLHTVDPELRTLRNVNTCEEYAQALREWKELHRVNRR